MTNQLLVGLNVIQTPKEELLLFLKLMAINIQETRIKKYRASSLNYR